MTDVERERREARRRQWERDLPRIIQHVMASLPAGYTDAELRAALIEEFDEASPAQLDRVWQVLDEIQSAHRRLTDDEREAWMRERTKKLRAAAREIWTRHPELTNRQVHTRLTMDGHDVPEASWLTYHAPRVREEMDLDGLRKTLGIEADTGGTPPSKRKPKKKAKKNPPTPAEVAQRHAEAQQQAAGDAREDEPDAPKLDCADTDTGAVVFYEAQPGARLASMDLASWREWLQEQVNATDDALAKVAGEMARLIQRAEELEAARAVIDRWAREQEEGAAA